MALPQNATTIEELIKAGENVTISYDNLSFINTLSNGTTISIRNVVSDYIDDMKRASVQIKLDDEQYQKYCFKPKLLCFDTYGNAEVYFIILLINNIADVREFDKHNIRMLSKEYMNAILTAIVDAEKDNLDNYNSKK